MVEQQVGAAGIRGHAILVAQLQERARRKQALLALAQGLDERIALRVEGLLLARPARDHSHDEPALARRLDRADHPAQRRRAEVVVERAHQRAGLEESQVAPGRQHVGEVVAVGDLRELGAAR